MVAVLLFKQKTAYEVRISDWSADVCSSDLAEGVVENMARDPEGGDIDQIAAVAAGECDIAVANTYYLGRLLASDDPDDRAVGEKIGVIFPNQGDRGKIGRASWRERVRQQV